MRFIIGLLLGLGMGFAVAILFAPEKGRQGHREEHGGAEGFGGNHDTMDGLRRAMARLQEQVREAWGEAREAAQEAEKEMRARYERSVSREDR